MPGRSRKRLPNPFYVLLMVVSTAFVVTALAYYIGPEVVRQATAEAGPGTRPRIPGLVFWLDRRAPTILAIEFIGMLILGLLAMATDHWFGPPKPDRATQAR